MKFIGDPNAERVQPYKYLFPSNIALEKKKKIARNYEKIQMAHYTMFCHLAGAFFQEEELVNARSVQDLKERYFRCCEHFESAYMHLGSAFYVLETLWNTVLKLSGYRGGGGRFGKLENYLNQRGKAGLAQRLRNIDSTMMIRRHLPVHYGRVFAMWYRGELYVPLNVKEEMMWSQASETIEWRKAEKQLHSDIVRTEETINELHEALIDEYGNFIIGEGIQIDYGKKT